MTSVVLLLLPCLGLAPHEQFHFPVYKDILWLPGSLSYSTLTNLQITLVIGYLLFSDAVIARTISVALLLYPGFSLAPHSYSHGGVPIRRVIYLLLNDAL